MPPTKAKPGKKASAANGARSSPGASANLPADVLTLAEAAAYLRVSADEVVRLVQEQGLPGRPMGGDWRFLTSALQDWLRLGSIRPTGFFSHLGALRDDPDLEPMLEAIYQRRGRPMVEER